MQITYTRHLTQLEKNKEWIDGSLAFKGSLVQLLDENGYLACQTYRTDVVPEKNGRYIVGKYLVDIDDEDVDWFKAWKRTGQSPGLISVKKSSPTLPVNSRSTTVSHSDNTTNPLIRPFKTPLIRGSFKSNHPGGNQRSSDSGNPEKDLLKATGAAQLSPSTKPQQSAPPHRYSSSPSKPAVSGVPFSLQPECKPNGKRFYSQSEVSSARGLVQPRKKSSR